MYSTSRSSDGGANICAAGRTLAPATCRSNANPGVWAGPSAGFLPDASTRLLLVTSASARRAVVADGARPGPTVRAPHAPRCTSRAGRKTATLAYTAHHKQTRKRVVARENQASEREKRRRASRGGVLARCMWAPRVSTRCLGAHALARLAPRLMHARKASQVRSWRLRKRASSPHTCSRRCATSLPPPRAG